MSKSTKIIAALGVVAGLGVAALPAFTYAASVSGNADVIVEVTPAISLAIAGNNDTATGYGRFFNSDPSGVYTDTDGGLSTNTSSSKVSMSSNQIVEGNTNAYSDANKGGGFMSTLTVNTNDVTGYSLSVKADSTAGASLKSAANDTIAPIATAGEFTPGAGAWGVKTAADYSASAQSAADIINDKWYPVTTIDQTIRTAKASATGYTNEQSVVLYGVSTAAAQPTGTYKTTLVYTASTNQ